MSLIQNQMYMPFYYNPRGVPLPFSGQPASAPNGQMKEQSNNLL